MVTTPPGSVEVVTVSGSSTFSVKDFEPLCLPLSLAFTVKVAEPAKVGVPLIKPLVEFRESPAGSAPLDTQNVGEVPLTVAMVSE
jgi:hypothetical protein